MLQIKLMQNRYMALALLILMFFLPAQTTATTESKAGYFEYLQERLISDGFDKNRIKKLYSSRKIDLEIKGISLYFGHREAKLNYDQFIAQKSIKSARNYMKKHKSELARMEKAYGVDGKIITAIILVETRLGTVIGNRSILNSLSTMASLADPVVQDIIWAKISNSGGLTREKFQKWSGKKSKWAYAELKSFLKYANREGIDPSGVYGSYAGAMGIAQFMPSNILSFAKDGNRDGRIDLFNHADAIASIASYLKHFGWHPKIDKKKAHKVLCHYNHSKYYVNTILKISELLKG